MRSVAGIMLLAATAGLSLVAGQGGLSPALPGGGVQAAPTPAQPTAAQPALAPLAAALKANYSIFWTAIEAARLEKLFDDKTAALTVLAPTDEAWLKRLPSLTAGANLTLPQLLSDGKARVLEQVINYHVLPGRPLESLEQLNLRGRLPTNAASCSAAKNVEVAAIQPGDGQVTLASSLGGTARTVGEPTTVTGGSFIFPIDDILLPATVTVPIEAALAGPADLNRSAIDTAALAPLVAQLEGKEPLPLTDEVGLAARERAAEAATAVPVGGGGGDGGGGEEASAPARRRVAVPTLPPSPEEGVERAEDEIDTPSPVASLGGGPAVP